MNRTEAVVLGVLAAALAAGFGVFRSLPAGREMAGGSGRCGPGFFEAGARCCVAADVAHCGEATECPLPLVRTLLGCDAPEARIAVPETQLLLGASDWEAEGRVPKRELRVRPFLLDAFEATEGGWFRAMGQSSDAAPPSLDPARAKTGMTFDEAEHYCLVRGGRLPTDDEWIAAAAGPKGARYPWGDTGAVCRRGAWGLKSGPCDDHGTGPDTVGAHPDGRTETGLYDMAGNVAEWVRGASGQSATRGGSWATALATELRTWNRQEVPRDTRTAEIGVRCAYEPPALRP